MRSADTPREAIELPPDGDGLTCLLETEHGRIQLQFGYRGCFGGSDNDLDLDVTATAFLKGHLWTGPSSSRATEGVTLTGAQGRAYLRRLAEALGREDEASDVVTTTRAFVRIRYWCGDDRSEPFMIETQSPSEEDDRFFAGMLRRTRAARRHPYSRVHATIAVARDILTSAPGSDGERPRD